MTGINHSTTKSTGERGYAADWNADHVIGANIDWGSFKITNLADPTSAQDAATKAYVDTAVTNVTGTLYKTIGGLNFVCMDATTADYFYDIDNGVIFFNSATNEGTAAAIELPQGAVITNMAVYGVGASTPATWTAYRDTLQSSGSPQEMATGSMNSGSSSISYATIDNTTYRYWFEVYPFNGGGEVDSATITYTLA